MPSVVTNPYIRKQTIDQSKHASRSGVNNNSTNNSTNNNRSNAITSNHRNKDNVNKNTTFSSPPKTTTPTTIHTSSSTKSTTIVANAVTPPPSSSSSSSSSHSISSSTKTKPSSSSSSQRQQPSTKKPQKSIKASFKAQLRKEINNLKKQKQQQIQNKHSMILQKQKEEERQKRLLFKQKLEKEKEQRKQARIEEKKKEKERLKLKLQRDLELKQKIEEEKLERKKKEREEREKIKEEKRKERELKRQMEIEKRRLEIQKAQQEQLALRAKMLLGMNASNNGNAMMMMMYPSTNVAQNVNAEQNQHLAPSVPYPMLHHSYNPFNNYTPYNPFTMSLGLHQMHSTLTGYQGQGQVQSQVAHTQQNNINPYINYRPIQSFPFSSSISNYNYYPNLSTRTLTTRSKKIADRPKKEKDMKLHENPLEPPSPFCKTHVLLPYQITIYKEEGQSFGMNIRFESRGTLVEINDEENAICNNAKEKNANGDIGTKTPLNDQDVVIQPTNIENSNDAGTPDLPSKEDSDNLIDNPVNNICETKTISNTDIETSDNNKMVNSLKCNEGDNKAPNMIEMKDEKNDVESQQDNLNTINADIPASDIEPTASTKSSSEVIRSEHSSTTSDSLTKPIIADEQATSSAFMNNVINGSLTSDPVQSEVGLNGPKKKPKKKKLTFGVMSVLGAEIQNSRADEGTKQSHLIQTNDIILKINDQSLSGLTFQEAANLFSKIGSENGETTVLDGEKKIIKCTLTIAREKKVMKILDKLASLDKPVVSALPRKAQNSSNKIESVKGLTAVVEDSQAIENIVTKIPLVIDERQNKIVSGDFTPQEVEALIFGVRSSAGHYLAFVEQEDSNNLVPSILKAIANNPLFHQITLQRSASDFLRKWFHESNQIENTVMMRVLADLKKEWKKENDGHGTDSISEYMLDSQRSLMRNLPRSSKGCKCGSFDHEYVNDPKCILYRNLRHLSNFDVASKENNSKEDVFEKFDGKLNSIGAAHLLSLKRKKEEEEAERQEAAFVLDMERFQVTNLKQAIFSPTLLSVIVLSAISSVCGKYDDTKSDDCNQSQSNHDINMLNEEEDEELPLESLGKRRADNEYANDNDHKKRKLGNTNMVDVYCLAELLLHISKTWGHVYCEPEHVDYAW